MSDRTPAAFAIVAPPVGGGDSWRFSDSGAEGRGSAPGAFDKATATSQKPFAVIEELGHYYRRDNANVHRGLHELSARSTEAYEPHGGTVARFVGASKAEEIVFTRGTTEARPSTSVAQGAGDFSRKAMLSC